MRIQHNIMAMSAYRNYNTNTSALSKNLEKLSSGYKINRAGDDAAGLAISEKMRAQITGLNAAQKNVKDGISLVKTAEGAMQEIQDMLNRMDYLATQSANGTYQNEVDRENLQAEVDQLREEINRIASSANFNGIKLLDGSLDKGVDCTQYTSEIAQQVADNVNAVVGSGTIVHSTSLPQQETKFNVDFGNSVYTIGAAADDQKTVSLKVGELELSVTQADIKAAATGTANEGDQVSAEDIVKAFVTKYGENGASKGDVKFNEQAFKLEGTGNQLTFTQAAKPKTDAEVVDGAMKVTITGVTGGGAAGGTDPAPIDTAPKVGNVNPGDATTKAAAEVQLTFDPDKVQTITVGDKVFQINPNPAKGAAMAAAATFTGTGDTDDPFTVTRTADMTDEDIVAGIAAQLTGGVTISGTKFNVTAEGTTLKLEADAVGAVQIDGQDATEETFTAAIKAAVTSETKAPEGGDKPAGGLNVTANVGSDGKAKAEVDLSTELAKIPADPTTTKTATIGGKTYVWGDGATGGVDLSIGDSAITAEAVKNAIKDKILSDAGTAYSAADTAWEGDKLILTNKAAGTGTWTTQVAGVTPTETVAGAAQATAGTAAATVGPDNLKAGDTLKVGDKTLNITEEHLADISKLETAIKALAPTNFDVTATANTTAGTVAITLTEKAGKEGTNNADALKGALGVTPAAPKNENGGSAGAAFAAAVPAAATDAPGTTADYNASTEVIQQGAGPGSNRLASTYMDITEVKDGSALKVGDKTYIFAVGKDSAVKASGANQVVVDMKNWTGKEADFVDNALKKLTETAEADGNAMFSVAYQGNGRLTFTEQETYQATAGGNAVDLSTRDAIAKQFGYAVDGIKTGGTLKLQIGDTSDEFNQMDVSVGDMHTNAMGTKGGQSIADIDIGTQAGAAKAVDVIKNAINYVSSVRGTLGAVQNRLDHTANNLSVMAENIQDAESTIRDTDVAEEMMSYVKNNILVQSAQAMLAQANQVPQGVLQLLG